MRRGLFPSGTCNLVTQWPGADPGVGAEFSQTVPAGRRWVVRSLAARLTCAATFGARNPSLRVRDPAGNVIFYFAANLGFLISSVNQLQWANWGINWPAQAIGAVTYNYYQIPPMILDGGSIIDSITLNLAAGDQWNLSGANGGVCVEEYLVNTP